MTYKEKYEDLDRSQLPEKAIVIIDTMKKDSNGFTDTEALEVIGPKFDQVIAKLKSSGYDTAFKSLQKKEPEPKTPVAQAKKIVKQAIKQPKTTAKTAKPVMGAFKKGAVGELAKKIRKEGEAWPTALKRAGQMIKEQKSGVQKKANSQYKKLNSLLTKMPALGKGTDVERDAPRKAKPVGKRTAKSGSTYYEYRSNRTDVRQGKGYPYLKLGAMLAKGGEVSKMYDEITMFDEISEKQISFIIKKMNEAKGPKNFDKELQKLVNWVWDNEPLLSKDQNVKGIKFLKNLAFMANGKSRSNSPFGSREEYTVKNFAYFKLRGFHDVSLYGQVEQYVPLYTVFDDEGYGFEYFYYAGKVNVVGAKGMTTKKGAVKVNFFDTDKKVKDFLNLSRVQFMARYKVTKDNYQKMVSAITRNIEGVFSHGGQMGGAGMFGKGGEMNKYDVVYNSYDQETGDMIADHESVYVMASSISEAKNKAMTMLEEGSRDEDFTIVRVNGMMADGGIVSKRERVIDYYFNNDVFDDPYAYDLEEGDLKDYKKVEEAIVKYHGLDNDGNVQERFETLGLEEFAHGGKFANGGMTKDLSGNYFSTNDFVGSNGLKDLANKVFGMGWKAEDDVDQIAELANHAGLKYVVIYAQNRSEWNNYRQIDTVHPTNDSNYDIFVIANQDWKQYVNDSEGDSDYDDGEYAKGGHMAKGGKMSPFRSIYEGQSVILTNTKNPIRHRFIGKELVIDEKQPNGAYSAFVRNTGEKVPFDIYEEDVEQYAKGGVIREGDKRGNYKMKDLKKKVDGRMMAKGGHLAGGGEDTILNNDQLMMLQYINVRNKGGEDEEKYIIMFFEDKKLLSRFDLENYKDDLINLGYLADIEDRYLVTPAGEEYLKKYGNKMTMGGMMAKGGITEHGLRVGDTIVSEIDASTIVVKNPASGQRTINISTGQSMAKGGMSDKIVLLVKDKKGNVMLRTTSTNKAADYCGLHGRENFTVETLDGRRIMAKGGRMGFKALSEKVASHYAGKSVPAKYQSEYGKFYDADEAKTVGNKVAAKVYRLQQGK